MIRALLLVLLLALAGCGPALPPVLDAGVASQRGAIAPSGDPADLAIDGDAFFVVARRLPVASLADLAFTRAGDFHFAAQDGSLRLLDAADRPVMGWATPVDVDRRPFGTSPFEAGGTDLAAFATTAPNGDAPPLPVALVPVAIDQAANPGAAGDLTFDAQGMLRVEGAEPRDAAGPLNVHVVLARPERPAGLRAIGGHDLAWDPAAGALTTGTAAKEPSALGATNVLRAAALEALP